MAAGVTTIHRHWWAHGIVLIFTPLYVSIAGAMAWASYRVLLKPDGWWVAPLLLLGSAIFGLVVVIALNAIFTYRVEIDMRGLRIIGNFYTHKLTWQEITRIYKRHNHRIPGYHVGIEVDGSNLPRRHWCNLWFAGYYIHPGMEKGGIELTAYLKRKRREYRKRQAAQATEH